MYVSIAYECAGIRKLQRLIEWRREARHGAPVTGRLRCYGAGLISRMAAYVVVAVLLVLAPDVGAQVLQEYRIGPGDRLNITIFGHNDLSGEVQVDGSGRISMPLIGQLMANSKTIMELQEEVTATLDKDYIINPRVSVEVVNYRPFYILGQVNRPGSYSYIEGMTVRMAVAIAGGFTRRADEDVIVIILANDPEQVEYEVTQGGRVLPGDSIEVERRLF
jgi:polysaccharide export outer membrane protein